MKADVDFYHEAFLEAQKGLQEGGIPIGAVIVYEGKILGRGHNRRLQKNSAIFHAEIDAIENAGRFTHEVYQACTLYTTLSPCAMCTGAALLYQIPRIVIGENKNFKGEEALLVSRGVDLLILQDAKTIQMMEAFISSNPSLWNEDIGIDNRA